VTAESKLKIGIAFPMVICSDYGVPRLFEDMAAAHCDVAVGWVTKAKDSRAADS
jgi:hypothetical protein